jgi:hypothetical protein
MPGTFTSPLDISVNTNIWNDKAPADAKTKADLELERQQSAARETAAREEARKEAEVAAAEKLAEAERVARLMSHVTHWDTLGFDVILREHVIESPSWQSTTKPETAPFGRERGRAAKRTICAGCTQAGDC